ncbi:hypothetical protein [Aeromonas sp. FDAARGOS 1417]|uniref:hypothetical protein n=1 Tax=Aeromonas TaxID=642 RepID=UPI001C248CE9|nr:hypothetical protein [Aeromonas sp. FDAARGOS 1417]QWZ65948.1 hypothetical protein I6L47_09515 [Aeromonas sp. FDAARGOS 1417]
MMSWKEFLLEAFRIYRGTLVSKVVLAIITLAATLLGASPWWSSFLTPIIEKHFDVKISVPSIPIGIVLLVLAVALTLLEMFRLYRLESLKVQSDSISKEMQAIQSDDAFFRLRSESEKSALSILRRLIDMHIDIHGSDPVLTPIGKQVRYGDEEAVYRYIDAIIVGQTSQQTKQDFFSLVGDATGHPLAYKFVRVYEGLIKEAESKSKTHLVHGTPLFQAFSNITHAAMLPIRKKAYWEEYV